MITAEARGFVHQLVFNTVVLSWEKKDGKSDVKSLIAALLIHEGCMTCVGSFFDRNNTRNESKVAKYSQSFNSFRGVTVCVTQKEDLVGQLMYCTLLQLVRSDDSHSVHDPERRSGGTIDVLPYW